MEDFYYTTKEENQAEFVEKHSRFIGYCKPISTEQEAIDFIGSVIINYKNEVKKDSKKIRISFENKDTEIYKELIQSLIELSFIKVAELKDELTIGQDVLIYDYFY